MKRSSHEVAGGPRYRDVRPAVAGRRVPSVPVDVFSTASHVPGPMAIAVEEAELLADFADFMSGEEEIESSFLPTPDPSFRDRLRRRLWRGFVISYARNGGDSTH